MSASGSQVRLGIDFGTSNTVAVLELPGRPATPLLFDGSPVLPSAVFASEGKLLVGRDAERAAMSDPARFEPNPKRCIADGMVQLGPQEYPAVNLIAAVLARVADESARVIGRAADVVVLTHPAGWGNERLRLLASAARLAGLPEPRFAAEPVAAATHFTVHLGHDFADDSHVVVYDLGGGTFDVSVVRASGDGVEVAASGGLSDVGGVDIDFAIIKHLERTFAHRADEWRRLREPSTPSERRQRRELWRDVREAKEILSRESKAALFLPLLEVDAHLTREELDTLARSMVEQTVALTLDVLSQADIGMRSVAGLFLVGGASRMPLTSTMLMRETQMAPTVLEQPELVVASGAVDAPSRPAPPPANDAPTTMVAMPAVIERPVVFRGVARVPRPADDAPGLPVGLQPPPPAPMTTLPGKEATGGSGPVSAVALHDGALATATGGGVTVSTLATGERVAVMDGHAQPPATVCWAPAEPLLAAAIGAQAKIWRFADGEVTPEPERVLNCPRDITLADWSAAGLAVGDVGEILLWDTETGECARTWKFGTGAEGSQLRALSWSADGKRLAAGGSHGNIKIFDADADKPSMVLSVAPISVRSLAWSPDGDWLASGDAGGQLRIWQLSDSSAQPIAHAHEAAIQALAWSPDGKQVASGGIDDAVRIWDAGSGREERILTGHSGTVTSLCWTPDSCRLISGSADGSVRVWDAATGTQVRV
ncbi:MAG TPA: Hsp70 family protein [Stackebrandtia sp.]|uniref:Hsp70 family protein n=1 Tax=Stackebrandtia sp. TaxID=2023065 RepID=UPI002D570D46|nr:Hsp70 family protein [Stackebrandtia sp.]HZE41454.1 Hsp70 family protein [Stackebrandtia sp.]